MKLKSKRTMAFILSMLLIIQSFAQPGFALAASEPGSEEGYFGSDEMISEGTEELSEGSSGSSVEELSEEELSGESSYDVSDESGEELSDSQDSASWEYDEESVQSGEEIPDETMSGEEESGEEIPEEELSGEDLSGEHDETISQGDEAGEEISEEEDEEIPELTGGSAKKKAAGEDGETMSFGDLQTEIDVAESGTVITLTSDVEALDGLRSI